MEWTSCAVVYTVSHTLVQSCTVSQGLVRSLIRLFTDMAPMSVFLKNLKSYTAFTDTLEWPECNSDKATVGSVV